MDFFTSNDTLHSPQFHCIPDSRDTLSMGGLLGQVELSSAGQKPAWLAGVSRKIRHKEEWCGAQEYKERLHSLRSSAQW